MFINSANLGLLLKTHLHFIVCFPFDKSIDLDDSFLCKKVLFSSKVSCHFDYYIVQ
jgi:hypothetical protein